MSAPGADEIAQGAVRALWSRGHHGRVADRLRPASIPPGAVDPNAWGDPETARERFGAAGLEIRTELRHLRRALTDLVSSENTSDSAVTVDAPWLLIPGTPA